MTEKKIIKSVWVNDTISKLAQHQPPLKKSGEREAKYRNHMKYKRV